MIAYVDTLQSNLAAAGPLLLASLLVLVGLCRRPKTPDAIRMWADKSGLDPDKPELTAQRLRRLTTLFTVAMVFFSVMSAVFLCLAFTVDSRKEREGEYQRTHMWPTTPLHLEPQPHPFTKKQEVQQPDREATQESARSAAP